MGDRRVWSAGSRTLIRSTGKFEALFPVLTNQLARRRSIGNQLPSQNYFAPAWKTPVTSIANEVRSGLERFDNIYVTACHTVYNRFATPMQLLFRYGTAARTNLMASGHDRPVGSNVRQFQLDVTLTASAYPK